MNMQDDGKGGWRSNVNGRQESVNALRGSSVPHENCPTQAKTGLEVGHQRLHLYSRGCPVQAPLGRGFSSGRTLTVGKDSSSLSLSSEADEIRESASVPKVWKRLCLQTRRLQSLDIYHLPINYCSVMH